MQTQFVISVENAGKGVSQLTFSVVYTALKKTGSLQRGYYKIIARIARKDDRDGDVVPFE